MIAAQHLPILSMACAAFAAAVLVRKTPHPVSRILIMLCLGVYLTGQFAVMRLAGATTPDEAAAAARTLFLVHALGAAPWALLASLLGGVDKWWRFRGRMVFVGAVGVAGVALATLSGSELVVAEISRAGGFVRVGLGVAGKLLLVYVTAVAAFMLTQIETLLRASLRLADRVPRVIVAMVGLSVIVYVYVAAEAFLYSRIQADTLVIASLPMSITCAAAGALRLRRSIDDMRFPVARGVVYSSFTLFVLGVLMILLGLMSRFAELAGLSLNRTFFIATSGVAAGLGVSIWASPAWKRRLSQFIDENFYVNRHDYRKEWARMARAVRLSPDRKELVVSAARAVREIFAASDVYVAIADPAAVRFSIYDAEGEVVTSWQPPRDGALARVLASRHAAVSFEKVQEDIALIPAYVENEEALETLAATVIAPMISGGRLLGFLVLGDKSGGAPHPPEDLSLMTVVGAELANAVYGHLLLREVEERREGEALVKLSSFVLHDLKNGVSSLQGILEGAASRMDEPEFRRDLVSSLSATSLRMSRLIERLGELRSAPRAPELKREPLALEKLLRRALHHCAVDALDDVSLTVHVPEEIVAVGDPEMLEQVFVNVVRNALEAMDNRGPLTVRATMVPETGMTRVLIEDRGCGMEPSFVAESLFRPFASTKTRGLGIGLYQCKNIVEDHGGRICVETQPGEGTRVELLLPAEWEAECETVS